jgi:transcriptional regulator with XRE-family HTH domain
LTEREASRRGRRRDEVDPSPVLGQFAENLRAIREEKGLTPEALANRCELGLELLIEMEEAGDHVPNTSHVLRLTRVLEVRPSALVAGVSWSPYEVIAAERGRFEVAEDSEIVEEIEALQGRKPGRPRSDGRP